MTTSYLVEDSYIIKGFNLRPITSSEKSIIKEIIDANISSDTELILANIFSKKLLGSCYADISKPSVIEFGFNEHYFNLRSGTDPSWFPNFIKRVRTNLSETIQLINLLEENGLIAIISLPPGDINIIGEKIDGENYIAMSTTADGQFKHFANLCRSQCIIHSSMYDFYENKCKTHEELKAESEAWHRKIAIWVTCFALIVNLFFQIYKEFFKSIESNASQQTVNMISLSLVALPSPEFTNTDSLPSGWYPPLLLIPQPNDKINVNADSADVKPKIQHSAKQFGLSDTLPNGR